MKYLLQSIGALSAVLLQPISAHYMFSRLVVDGVVTRNFKYVRNTDYETYPDASPYDRMAPYETYNQAMIETTNMTCGKNAFNYAQYTSTATVQAGSKLGFRTQGSDVISGEIWHEGPAQIYMTRAPDGVALEEFTGWDSDWFKVAYWGPLTETKWYTEDKEELIFDLPATTPPGKYLLRVEHWMPLPGSYSQWYINCAHINVVGPGGGNPQQFGTVKFPGSYQFTHPGITLPPDVMDTTDHTFHGSTSFLNLTGYTPPGPQVWRGE